MEVVYTLNNGIKLSTNISMEYLEEAKNLKDIEIFRIKHNIIIIMYLAVLPYPMQYSYSPIPFGTAEKLNQISYQYNYLQHPSCQIMFQTPYH